MTLNSIFIVVHGHFCQALCQNPKLLCGCCSNSRIVWFVMDTLCFIWLLLCYLTFSMTAFHFSNYQEFEVCRSSQSLNLRRKLVKIQTSMFVQYICKFELTTRALGIEGLCAPMEVRMVKHLVKYSTAWKVFFPSNFDNRVRFSSPKLANCG